MLFPQGINPDAVPSAELEQWPDYDIQRTSYQAPECPQLAEICDLGTWQLKTLTPLAKCWYYLDDALARQGVSH